MKKTSAFVLVVPIVLLMLGAVTVLGQEKRVVTTDSGAVTVTGVAVAPQSPTPATGVSTFTFATPQGAPPPPPPGVNTFTFMNSEFMYDGKPIKGAPYTAQAITEMTQTLVDGNRIVNRSTATLYRDSEGRTRREQTLKSIGNMATGEPLQSIMISDPVAGVSYTLDPANKTARKAMNWSYKITPAAAGSGGMTWSGQSAGQAVSIARSGSGDARVTTSGGETQVFTAKTPPPEGRERISIAGDRQVFARTPGMEIKVSPEGESENFNTEKLGTQNVEGVMAEGTRTTITIPAGRIGNERPIEIVDERWYSPELRTFVMTRHADPRSGEMVYRLTNIDRNEPAHSLFEVPPDYQLKERSAVEGTMAPMPARMRKPLDQ